MKYIVTAVWLLLSAQLFSQSSTATIDSISQSATPTEIGQLPALHSSFGLYFTDTVGVSSIDIEIGSEDGGHDFYKSTISLATTSLLWDVSIGKFYLNVDVGDFLAKPPFAQAWLTFSSGGTSPVTKRQFVFF